MQRERTIEEHALTSWFCLRLNSFKEMKLCACPRTLSEVVQGLLLLPRSHGYSGGYHWKCEERGKRKRLRGRGNLGLSDKPQRGLLTPLVVLALSSHLTAFELCFSSQEEFKQVCSWFNKYPNANIYKPMTQDGMCRSSPRLIPLSRFHSQSMSPFD